MNFYVLSLLLGKIMIELQKQKRGNGMERHPRSLHLFSQKFPLRMNMVRNKKEFWKHTRENCEDSELIRRMHVPQLYFDLLVCFFARVLNHLGVHLHMLLGNINCKY